MRKPSASTKPSLIASSTCVTIGSPNDNSRSHFANARQTLLPEEFERAHQKAQITGTGGLEHQVDDASPDLIATAFDLFDDRVRLTEEICRPHTTDTGCCCFAPELA